MIWMCKIQIRIRPCHFMQAVCQSWTKRESHICIKIDHILGIHSDRIYFHRFSLAHTVLFLLCFRLSSIARIAINALRYVYITKIRSRVCKCAAHMLRAVLNGFTFVCVGMCLCAGCRRCCCCYCCSFFSLLFVCPYTFNCTEWIHYD